MASMLVPVLYIVIVIGSLLVFSHFNRKQSANKKFEPYFPSHPERNAYVTLLQATDPPASDALLKSALLRRAIADVGRVLRLREDKPALQNLLQKGSVGDDVWNSLLAAEKELEGEIMEVVAEANTFVEGWGTVIFQTANEMIANEKIRAVFESAEERKLEYATRFGMKIKSIPIPAPISVTAATPPVPPNTPATALPQSAALTPQTSKILNNTIAEVSSEGESVGSPTSPTSPSNKKNKKKK